MLGMPDLLQRDPVNCLPCSQDLDLALDAATDLLNNEKSLDEEGLMQAYAEAARDVAFYLHSEIDHCGFPEPWDSLPEGQDSRSHHLHEAEAVLRTLHRRTADHCDPDLCEFTRDIQSRYQSLMRRKRPPQTYEM